MPGARFGKVDIRSSFQGASGLTKFWRSCCSWAHPEGRAFPAPFPAALALCSGQGEEHLHRAAQMPACSLRPSRILLEKCFTWKGKQTSTSLALFLSSAEQLIDHQLKEETIETLPVRLQGPFQDHLSMLVSGTDIAKWRGCRDDPQPVRPSLCPEE